MSGNEYAALKYIIAPKWRDLILFFCFIIGLSPTLWPYCCGRSEYSSSGANWNSPLLPHFHVWRHPLTRHTSEIGRADLSFFYNFACHLRTTNYKISMVALSQTCPQSFRLFSEFLDIFLSARYVSIQFLDCFEIEFPSHLATCSCVPDSYSSKLYNLSISRRSPKMFGFPDPFLELSPHETYLSLYISNWESFL